MNLCVFQGFRILIRIEYVDSNFCPPNANLSLYNGLPDDETGKIVDGKIFNFSTS